MKRKSEEENMLVQFFLSSGVRLLAVVIWEAGRETVVPRIVWASIGPWEGEAHCLQRQQQQQQEAAKLSNAVEFQITPGHVPGSA